MKKFLVFLTLFFGSIEAFPCTTCNKDLQKAIFDSTFYPNLFKMMMAFIIIGIIVVVLAVITTKREKRKYQNAAAKLTIVPLITATTTLGIAIGGFIDGIFFHQILQWHEMLSNKLPPVTLMNKSVNMFWDGIFHAFCLIVAIIGICLMFRLLLRKDIIVTKTAFNGGLILGWGIFNIVEGIIDHQILKLHNLREITTNVLAWNYGFLAFAVVLILIGSLMIKKGSPQRLYVRQDY